MRKFIYIFLLLILILTGLTVSVFATESAKNLLNLNIKTINGEEMIWLRELGNRFNWDLNFDNLEKYVYIGSAEKKIILKIQQGEINNNEISVSPQIFKGRTYIPVTEINILIQELEQGADKMLELLAHISVNKQKCKPGDKLEATIELCNLSDRNLILKYPSGKLYDLNLLKDGEEIWRWSRGKYFTMALINKKLPAGEKLKYNVEVPISPDLKEGNYILTGAITTKESLSLNKVEIEVQGSN